MRTGRGRGGSCSLWHQGRGGPVTGQSGAGLYGQAGRGPHLRFGAARCAVRHGALLSLPALPGQRIRLIRRGMQGGGCLAAAGASSSPGWWPGSARGPGPARGRRAGARPGLRRRASAVSGGGAATLRPALRPARNAAEPGQAGPGRPTAARALYLVAQPLPARSRGRAAAGRPARGGAGARGHLRDGAARPLLARPGCRI
jgi:hypothetical protein